MMTKIRKIVNPRRILALFSLLIFAMMLIPYIVTPTSAELGSGDTTDLLEFDGVFDWDNTLDVKTSTSEYIGYSDFRNNYCKLSNTPSECASAANGKKIRFDTAEDLYRFSVDVSFEQVYLSSVPSENYALSETKKAVLLSLNYVLGKNIDYSVMGAKTFIPIGYWFADTQSNEYQNIFTGTFDGQGFAITNLYVAGYDYLVYTDVIDSINAVDIALSSYYTMFPFNAGIIKNFGLLNPTFELLNLHIDIDKVSNIVGINLSGGLIDHVYVIDSRTDVTAAGIRYKVGTSSEVFEAAGLVHTNQGIFTNSYYVSKVVVNGSYINKFIIEPVLYSNQGTISNLVYDSSVYLLNVVVGTSTFSVKVPNSLAVGETTSLLKSSSSSLNTATDRWYFYQNDCYPLLQGLEYDETKEAYLIDNAIDLAFFSRVMAFVTPRSGVTFAYDNYILTGDIDMSVLSPGAYSTPAVTFYGTFSGHNESGSNLVDNFYIYNLNITIGTVRGTGFYAGLFSIVGANAVLSNFNISQSSIALTNTETYYSNVFYVGAVTGRVTAATIQDVIVDMDINMGTNAIGKTYLGGIAGEASGIISRVSNYGNIDMNSHTFQSSYNVNPKFYIGGIVGAADLLLLTLSDAVNYGIIHGFGTTSTFSFVSGVTSIESRVGGVIGYILNTSTIKHQIVNVANNGDIYIVSTINSSELPSSKKVGGVFGELAGYAPVLESNDVYKFANLYNNGIIHAYFDSASSVIRAAGIGVSNTTEAVEYALLFNHGSFDFNTTGASYSSQMFKFTGTIYDISSYPVTLSRVYNYADLSYNASYYLNVNPLYYSLNNNSTLIRYSANYGDVSFMNNSGLSTITLSSTLIVSGITTSSNVDFLNVQNKGDINVVNVNLGSNLLYISGITTTLNSGKYIKNSLNEGNITFAKINGTGNIFVGGIVNTNLSGDLHFGTQSTTHPEATIGIINTMNYGNLSSSYGLQAQNLYGIIGTNNTFASGIATLNAGSIQNALNLGNVTVYNSNTTSTPVFATDDYLAGLVTTFHAGVVLGGITAVSLSGNARIYDTGNNGNIFAISDKFSRAGGILGSSLYKEAEAGGITAGMGLADTIQNSVLSNGLNFGDISAITNTIGEYLNHNVSLQNLYIYHNGSTYSSFYNYFYSTLESDDRLQINASAGGVIGYGLSVMKNMLNHGTISSTDVAGGIVGATYALGNANGYTTIVNIKTAINYGGVKAIATTNITNINKFSFANISSYYMADGNTFIFPTGYTREEPCGKRGFGGIFGRLQRGLNGDMTSNGGTFDFIVNANPNIDLIGRLDQVQNFSSSSRFFEFNDAIYYSAKLNDTTQVVFTGYYYAYARTVSKTSSGGVYTYVATARNLYMQVGNVSTSLGSPYTNFNFQSQTSYSNGTTRYSYYAPVAVPWITENPSDSHITSMSTQYMYDPSFPMRTDSTLTEYIYYMTYDLLADRFKTEGTNPRPNGMYVLSTSAGSTYGSVLPSNIMTDDIKLINEDYQDQISLLIDYSSVSVMYREALDTAVIDKYNALRQTIFNEKSELIASESTLLTMTENGGSSTVLSGATINYDTHTVTYQVSMEAFLTGQTTASYKVSSALTSAFSLIAKRPEDYYGGTPSAANLLQYRTLLYPEKDAGISNNYPSLLQVTLPSKSITSNVTLSLGYFTIFSEAFVGDNLFATSTYYTSYHVYIVFTPGVQYLPTGTLGITSVAFNGGGNINATDPADVSSLGDVNYNGSIQFTFTDTKGVLTLGYDFKNYFVLKYSDSSIVPTNYYTVTSVPVTINTATNPDTGTYIITFTFLPGIRMGDYHFEYRYFSSSTVQTVLFDKTASSQSSISTFDYYSDDESIIFNGLNITSDVNLGTTIFINTSTSNFTEYNNTGLAAYLSNLTYDISYMNSHSLAISPFAKVISARLVQVTYNAGYKTYQIEYIVQAEDGSTSTYIHNITERPIDLFSVLKNGNDTDVNDVFAVREDYLTTFSVDLGLDSSLDLYSVTPGSNDYFLIVVTATHLDGTTAYAPSEILGLSYSTSDILDILMTYETLPGIYTFAFEYYRDGTSNYVSLVTHLVITKQAGTDAYISDIRFSALQNETSYPYISITDENGVVDTSTGLDPRVYYEGIDYDDADLLGYRFYRIDGAVANTPLNEYMPLILEYLPYGATIARYAYDMATTSWYWTDEINNDSSTAEKQVLLADFTIFPDTGLEPSEGNDVVVRYRVTSEDTSLFTYYYVTVTDITYNVTLLFDIYYCTDETQESCTLASNSVNFSNQLVIISVKNYNTNGDDTVIGVTNPADYPVFSEIEALNNQMTQFYLTYAGEYRYSFGRNISGFYVFDVELPLDKYLNDIYTYEIQFLDYSLHNASDYVSYLKGKYFYIEYATKNRSRRFNIFIREVTNPSTDAPWGLFDFFKSWGNN
ncbi:MAG: hypothetical protein PHC62_04165 [Candidatus Izemoplasmatales bacterium]|nr:hypothetical protein [Candidatus Izemoplasmatales bacterium]